MTKKELKWRLSELPTGGEVAELVEQEIITKEEARDILFNETEQEPKTPTVKKLEKQIEFLEELVKDLSKRPNQVISTTYVDNWVKRYTPALPQVWMSTSGTYSGTLGSTAGAMSLSNYTKNLIG
jgi:hypothetical protein